MRTRSAVASLAVLALFAVSCGDDGGGSASDFCDGAADLQEQFDSLGSGPPDPDRFRSVVDELRDLTPPDEIADDYNDLVDAFEEIATAMEGIDVTNPDPEAMQELQAMGERIQELESASQNVEDYLRDECGIDS